MKVEVQSGIVNGTEILMLAISLMIISVFVYAVLGNTVRIMLREWPTKSTTKKVDEGPPKCDICFDDLEGRIATCECGKRFHDSCAHPTGSCPYCSADYSEFDTFESDVICPKCGKQVFNSQCRCGAIVPNEGRFVCVCGSNINQENLKCRKCGKTYAVGNDK